MSDNVVKVEGVEELTKALDKLQYGAADKAVKAAMTDAAKQAVKAMKLEMPKKMFRSLVRYKFKQGQILKFMRVGLMDRKKTLPQAGYPNTKGNNKYIWSVAYWLNYGTLNRRDRGHTFAQGVKNKSINSKRGVRPQKFYDDSLENVKKAYVDTFGPALDNRTKDFYGK